MTVKHATSRRGRPPKTLASAKSAAGAGDRDVRPVPNIPTCSANGTNDLRVRDSDRGPKNIPDAASATADDDVRLTAEERAAIAAAAAESAPPTIRTEGQRLLLAVPGTLELLGDSVGATLQAVALWRSGQRSPGPQWRRAMHERFGIPPEAWARSPLPEGYAPPAPTSFAAPLTDDDEPSPLDDVRRLLRSLREDLDRPNLLARERAQLSDAFAKALERKTKLEEARALSEPRTIRDHPGWRRLREALIGALVRHPDAARDVAAAMQRELGDDEGT